MYFQLKQRNPADNNVNMLEEREVEKDLGEILEVTLKPPSRGEDPKIQSDPEKKPDPSSKGSLDKLTQYEVTVIPTIGMSH